MRTAAVGGPVNHPQLGLAHQDRAVADLGIGVDAALEARCAILMHANLANQFEMRDTAACSSARSRIGLFIDLRNQPNDQGATADNADKFANSRLIVVTCGGNRGQAEVGLCSGDRSNSSNKTARIGRGASHAYRTVAEATE